MPDKETAQEEWQRKTIEFARSINEFVKRGMELGWDKAGEEPDDPGREHLEDDVLAAVRTANADGTWDALRKQWPPAHSPFIDLLEENGQSIPLLFLLPDKSIIARIGSSDESGKVIHINGDTIEELNDIQFFGRCPNRRYFAVARAGGVEVTDGWLGPQVSLCPWPTGQEGVLEGFEAQPFSTPPALTRLIPFPDGQRVLLVSSEGIFVLSSDRAVRLLPTTENIQEHFDWLKEEHPEDELSLDLSMEHGAISTDGKLIAVGSQDSRHLLYDDRLQLVGKVGNVSEYPHYALFNAENTIVAFNSCQFYNGMTVGVPINLLPGLETEPYEEDDRLTLLDDNARVYAGAARQGEFIVGDASGYVRAFNDAGEPLWQFFIGSSIGDIDVSANGRTLVVSTYAGFISIINLDAGQQAAYQIGNSQHQEVRRWVFWKKEKQPLIW